MTDAQDYVATLTGLLAEYGDDAETCEAIRRADGGRLFGLVFGWYAADHPDRVTTERGTLESADCRDVAHPSEPVGGDQPRETPP